MVKNTKDFKTMNWIIGILVATWIATFVVGYMHVAAMLPEPANPIAHTFQDWAIVLVFTLPIAYVLARVLPSKQSR